MDKFTSIVRDCLTKAFKMYGIELSINCVDISYDVTGYVAGKATRLSLIQYKLRFNLEAIDKHWDEMVNNTVPHEVAHIVAWLCPLLRAKGHDAKWSRICRSLGGTGSRTHSYDISSARKEYLYIVNNVEYKLTSIRHKRVMTGNVYTCQDGRISAKNFIREVA